MRSLSLSPSGCTLEQRHIALDDQSQGGVASTITFFEVKNLSTRDVANDAAGSLGLFQSEIDGKNRLE